MSTFNSSRSRHIANVLGALGSGTHRAGTLGVHVLEGILRLLPDRDIRSVETGCGKSTVFFSNLSKHHTSFCYDDRDMADSSVRYVMSHPGFVSSRCTFVFGPTQVTLPKHEFGEQPPIDLALIDGPHGYPFPDLEYWILYPRLAPGGLLVIDDLMIPSIGRMYDILREDRMFEEVAVLSTTGVLRRTYEPALPQDGDHWWDQAHNFRQFPVTMQPYRRDFAYRHEAELDFSQKSVFDRHCVRGFEFWRGDGARTIDTSAIMRIKCDAQTEARLRVRLRLQITSLSNCAGGSIHVNDDLIVALPADGREIEAEFSCPATHDGNYRVEFRMPAARAIHDTMGNFNFRRAGLTLYEFSARPDNISDSSPTIRVLGAQSQEAMSVPSAAIRPSMDGVLKASDFIATLSHLCDVSGIGSLESIRVDEIVPPPVLCPFPKSAVRYLPLRGIKRRPTLIEEIGMLPLDGKRWMFVDFFAFEEEEFSYAVLRSLLHRTPNKKQIQVGIVGDMTDKLILVLEADYRARKIGRLGKFKDLPLARTIYRLWRVFQKYRLPMPDSVIRHFIESCAKSAYEANRHRLEERRLLLRALNLRSQR